MLGLLNKRFHLLFTLILFSGIFNLHAQVVYVDVNATGANNGTSWTDAYVNLQTAITNTAAGNELWVADGYYRTTSHAGFTMKEGVSMYGGFQGIENLRNERDNTTYFTILTAENLNDGDSTNNHNRVISATNLRVPLKTTFFSTVV